MDRAKQFIVRHFEVAVVVVLVAATAFAVLVAANKLAFLNFFYVPSLIAAYFLGTRKGVMVSVLAVLMVTIYTIMDPTLFATSPVDIPYINILLWGSFLIVTSYVVGSLYELKETALDDLRQAYEGILEILSKFIDAVDRYTKEHSVRVSEFGVQIAQAMNLSKAEIENIRVAGLLHDVGKVDLSVDVLRKATALNDEEYQHVKTHTTKAQVLLRPIGGLLRDVVPLITSHHENFDGSGYHGFAGNDIPLGARILAVADAYDSMISDRPYRTGRTPAEAFKEIERCCGTQFDPTVVAAFKTIMKAQVEVV